MKNSKWVQTLLLTTTCLAVMACGNKNFETLSDLNSVDGGNNGQSSGGGASTNPVADAYNKVDMNSVIDGGVYDKTPVSSIDKINNTLDLNLPIPGNPNLNLALEMPQLKGVIIEAFQDASGKSFLQVKVPLKYVIKGVKTLPATKLPNGDALPRMPSGELPSLGLALTGDQKVKSNLYIGVNAVGLFVETPFNPYLGLTLPIKNSAGTKINGYFSMIPAKGSSQGGFFLSVQLPNDVARIIDDYLAGIIN